MTLGRKDDFLSLWQRLISFMCVGKTKFSVLADPTL